MKKGFTLIELLAVIIILAVIALIATPVVLNVVENATNEARKNSVRGYADSVRLSYAEEMLKDTGRPLKELASEKTQGDEVICEYVKYDDKKSGVLLHSCKVEEKGNYCYINGNVYEDGSEECNNIINLIMSENIPYNTPNVYVVSQIPDGLEYSQSKEIGVEYPSLKIVEEHYYIKLSETIEINAISKCGSGELPSECIEESITSIDANTWYEVSGNVTFTVNKNLSIEAIIGNNNEYGSKKTYEVVNIDMNNPTITAIVTAATVSLELNDIEGLAGYGINQLTNEEPSYTEITGTSMTVEWTAEEAGTYVAWVKDVSGRVITTEFIIDQTAFCEYEVGQTWDFAYTGDVQEFNAPCSGIYKLEVWGAQGGTAGAYKGGLGGYSSGNKIINANSTLYLAVGGQGSKSSASSGKKSSALGGYNGGGTSKVSTPSWANITYVTGSGGGATHIATQTGLLSELEENKESILIVAGGGGGGNWDPGTASYCGSGGAGGGTSGEKGGSSGLGGTQSAGGSNGGLFGLGGTYANSDGVCAAGGGGYYGGGYSLNRGGGGGGSGYIGGLTDGQTIAGNASMPTHDGTSTMIGNTGNGYARITLVTISN